MPFVPAPNIVMVEWRCTRLSQKIENRLMVNFLGVPEPADMSSLAVEMWDWWETDHSLNLSQTVLLNEVVMTYMGAADGPQVTYAPDATTTGALVSIDLPNECSFCVSLRSGLRGRSARGRWYTLSVVNDQMLDPNFLTSAAANAFVADLNALRTIINTAGYIPTIVSYRSGGVPRPGGPVYYAFENAIATDTGIDSMRRRKPGVGT